MTTVYDQELDPDPPLDPRVKKNPWNEATKSDFDLKVFKVFTWVLLGITALSVGIIMSNWLQGRFATAEPIPIQTFTPTTQVVSIAEPTPTTIIVGTLPSTTIPYDPIDWAATTPDPVMQDLSDYTQSVFGDMVPDSEVSK